MRHLIFVYGTLKKGYSNNYLLKGAKFLGEATTVHKYLMYCVGFPYVLDTNQPNALPVKGEVYDVVDSDQMGSLDALESEGYMYCRTPILVKMGSDTVKAEMYIGHPTYWSHTDRLLYTITDAEGNLDWKPRECRE